MAVESPAGDWRRWGWLFGIALGCALSIIAIWILPTFLWNWTWPIRVWFWTWGPITLLHAAAFFVLFGWAQARAAILVRRLGALVRRAVTWSKTFPRPYAPVGLGDEDLAPAGKTAGLPAWVFGLLSRAASVLRTAAEWVDGWAWEIQRLPSTTHPRLRERIDRPLERLLSAPLTAVLVACCVLLAIAWVPHYLTWPWWADLDQFAIAAQSWDAGMLPYRDLADFDFPGPIYLFWVVGKLFGWGQTVAFNALDATMVAAYGIIMALWSRRVFGRFSPGLIGFLVFFAFYVDRDYTQVAQRDWQAPFFATLGLMAAEAWPGRRGRVASALAMAAALAFRPQAILFLPAFASAVDEGARRSEEPFVRTVWALLEWAALFVLGLLLAFGPLICAGIFDDFARVLSITHYGGQYNRVTGFRLFLMIYNGQVEICWGTVWLMVLLALLACTPVRRPARTWALALIGVLTYRPMSPVLHLYMWQPLTIVCAIAVAVMAAWVLLTPQLGAIGRLVLLGLLLYHSIPRVPRFASFSRSYQALGPLMQGSDPLDPPLGCKTEYTSLPGRTLVYQWADYRALLDYVRHSLPPDAKVANLFRVLPYPTINGPGGRLTPFPAAGGVIHLALVDPHLEDRFISALAESPDAYVVWVTDVGGFPRMAETVRRHYRPQARFGNLEVWRKRPREELAAQRH
jgi:hypothetical protein